MPVTVGSGKSINAYVYSVFGSSIQNRIFTGVGAVTELKLILKELLSAGSRVNVTGGLDAGSVTSASIRFLSRAGSFAEVCNFSKIKREIAVYGMPEDGITL